MRLWQGKKKKKSSQVKFYTCFLYGQSTPSYLFVPCSYTHDIEALSCDEVLIDSSALLAELGVSPEDLAKAIRADIKEKTKCCASVGMGECFP